MTVTTINSLHPYVNSENGDSGFTYTLLQNKQYETLACRNCQFQQTLILPSTTL